MTQSFRSMYRRYVQKLLSRRKKWWYAHITVPRYAKQVDHTPPTYLISFPRSGSNFLQNVLHRSSGFYCRPIYGELITQPHLYLSVKSHAASYAHLLDEIGRYMSGLQPAPNRYIVLWRDPRDVIISFYEYTQARRQVRLQQSEFLVEFDYYRAVPGCKGAVGPFPLTVVAAYKLFVQNWYVGQQDNDSILHVRYEELVNDPHKAFQRIFDFLCLDCLLRTDALSQKVAQQSYTRAERAVSGGWQHTGASYARLLEVAIRELGEEMELLGYADSRQAIQAASPPPTFKKVLN